MPTRYAVRRAGGNSIGIGVVGCGNAAEALHLPILRRLGARVVALADPEPGALAQLGDRFGVDRRYRDPAALLEDWEVDAIAVLTPPEVRAEIVVPCLQAGKHVLVEKPLALTLAECDTIVEAAARRPELRAMFGLPLRFHRLVRAARDFVASGRLGTPTAMHSAHFGPMTEIAPGRELSGWRFDRERGGGTLLDKGIHQYDLWRFLLGRKVTEVSALTRLEERADQASLVTARLEGGALASTVMATSDEASTRISVHGPGGRLDVDAHRFDGLSFQPADRYSGSPRTRLTEAAATIRSLPQGIHSMRLGGDFKLSYEGEWRHFLACVRGEVTLESTLHDGREATRLAFAAIESANRRATVEVAAQDRTEPSEGHRPVP
jgi:myo-inositol 2-dehydrogenase / D-chiro-inositol 1-dehydrogenase